MGEILAHRLGDPYLFLLCVHQYILASEPLCNTAYLHLFTKYTVNVHLCTLLKHQYLFCH